MSLCRCCCYVVVVLLLLLQPVNTTRVNAAEITSRVAALQSHRDRDNPGKAGFFEEFEVCVTYCFDVFSVLHHSLTVCCCIICFSLLLLGWGVGVVIWLGRGAYCLHMIQLMPLLPQNPIISCLIYIQSGFTVLVPAYPGCPGKEAVKRV